MFDGVGREELERIAARALYDLVTTEARVRATLILEGCLTCKDHKQTLSNLTQTQERCTALYSSDRRRGWVLDAVRAWALAECGATEADAVLTALAKHDDDALESGGSARGLFLTKCRACGAARP